MAKTRHDEVLLGILKEEAHLYPFLDVIFGFLYRCTDFYQIQHHPEDKFGFPTGVAGELVGKVFKRWQVIAERDRENLEKSRVPTTTVIPPPAIQEVEVTTLPDEPNRTHQKIGKQRKEATKSTSEKNSPSNDVTNSGETDSSNKFQNSDSSYNGAIRDGYQWSQSISDLDVQVTVPSHITRACDVKVHVSSSHISISALKEGTHSEWCPLVNGELCYKTNKEESIWSLISGQYIQIHLEKNQERWWDALLMSEPKIDLKSIDASRPMDDLSQEEQMKIEELMWNQERKRQGLPTSDNLALENVLKEAWDKEGSPFKGRPYNPKEVNFSSNTLGIPDCEGNT